MSKPTAAGNTRRLWATAPDIALVLLCLLCGLIGPAHADTPSSSVDLIERYRVAHWGAREGAPVNVNAIVQTTDGYLWLGTEQGLVRFDGLTFRRIETLVASGESLSSPGINALTATGDGSLWIGYQFGGVSRLRQGHLQHFGREQGLPMSSVMQMVRDNTGRMWIATLLGLYLQDGDRFRRVNAEMAVPGRFSVRLVLDREGTVWLGTDHGILALRPGANRFVQIPLPPAVTGDVVCDIMTLAPDGRVWAGVDFKGAHYVGPLPKPNEGWSDSLQAEWHVNYGMNEMTFGDDGVIWVPSGRHLRVLEANHPEQLDAGPPPATDTDPMFTVAAIRLVFIDREGTAWVGGEKGIDSYRRMKIVPLQFAAADTFALALAGPKDGVWLSHADGSLGRIAGAAVAQTLPRAGRSVAYALYNDSQTNALWIGGVGGLWRRDGDDIQRIPLPDALAAYPSGKPLRMFQAIATDSDGGVWISVDADNVYRLKDGQWTLRGSHPELSTWVAICMTTDRRKRLWIGYQHDRLYRLDDAAKGKFVSIPDLHVGNVLAITDGKRGVWVGGDKGVALIDEQGVHAFGSPNQSSLSGVTGVQETATGELWLNGGQGIVRVAGDDVSAALAHPRMEARVELFNALDGLSGPPTGIRPLPTMAQEPDGRLWFRLAGSVVSVMPGDLKPNVTAPLINVETLEADGTVFVASASPRLPALTRDVRIVYNALSLAIPERVQSRYRLDGQDSDWREGGNLREARYTNLAPGSYTFHVMAANNDGLWSAPSQMSFVIAPAFWQTVWFRCACLILAAGALWSIYRWRLRRATALAQATLRVQTEERERIARDLHDTLLQGIHGLTWKIQTIANGISPEDPARCKLEGALDNAEELVAESRRRVKMLRDDGTSPGTLLDALRSADAGIAPTHPNLPTFHCAGEEFDVTGPARIAICDIVREAFSNAVTHGRAASIDVILIFESRALTVRVDDDGIGMDAELAREGRPGHWGIVGMKERARELGGSLEIDAAIERGTNVTLRLPRSRIEPSRKPSSRWAMFLRIARPR